jgi:dimethylargininase
VSARFTRALLRLPGASYATGLTSAGLGPPELPLALEQHRRYALALIGCGLQIETLPADERYPDGTFVEDTAVLAPGVAVITRPGAASRRGETESIRAALGAHYAAIRAIAPPGTLDGGDVCEADGHYYIGLTARTNEAGAADLARHLAEFGHASTVVDVRDQPGLLHLKTGVSYLGAGRIALAAGLTTLAAFDRYQHIEVPAAESYAANCVLVNDRVLVAAGHPHFAARLAALGLDPLPLEMSEFRKMDGGLSCLSLRF